MTGKLKWRFDASTFKLLGRGLITDRITAIYELVKNSYDANATQVTVEFHEVKHLQETSEIRIRDNGLGMNLSDITDKWLVIGTPSKRNILFSPEPFNRRYIGEKGVGRFATDKLGAHLTIKTKQKADDATLEVTINWKAYDQLNLSSPVLFTDLENDYQYLPNDTTFPEGQGTEFCIRLLHEPWDKEMLLRLHNQLTRILAPTFVMNPPFDIGFYAPEFQMEYEKTKPQPIETLATLHITIPFDKIHQKQGFLTFHKETETFDIQYIEPKDFGLIRMEFYYFDSDAQKAFKSKYKNTSNYIEGVKIYRDGLICTPFAEYESALDKRRDILGIDTRRSQWDILKINTREVIGIVDITKEQNPNIIDTTNRQDFLDNEAYQQLKKFIRKQLDVLAAYKALKRTQQKQRIANSLVKAPQEMDEVTIQLQQIMNQHPTLSSDIQKVMAKMEQVKASVKAGIKEQKATEKEFLQKQELYLSLMTIQDYANHLAHGLRFYLAPLKHIAEFFFNNYPNLEYEQQFKDDSKKMFGLTEKMSHLINFMLNYTDKGKKESFFIKNLLEELDEAYEAIFEQEQIQFKILMEMEIELKGNRKFLEDVFSNLISNAIKALKEVDDKVIQCQCYTEDKKIYILFADNGCGVDKSVEKSMFEMFVTTTAEQGGSGFGLFIAKQRMNALKGNIELVKSVFAPRGATFKLSLPLKPN